jgi:competence protein ComEA
MLIFPASSAHTGPAIDIKTTNTVINAEKNFIIASLLIEYREKNGPFETPEEIINVSGIGPKTFELNKDRIVVD